MVRIARMMHSIFTLDFSNQRAIMTHALQVFIFLYLVLASILITTALPSNALLDNDQCLDALASIVLLGALCYHIATAMGREMYSRIDILLTAGILAVSSLTLQSPILSNAAYYLTVAVLSYILSTRRVMAPWTLVIIMLASNIIAAVGLGMMTSPVLDHHGDQIRMETWQFVVVNLAGFPFFTILIHSLGHLLHQREGDLAAIHQAERRLAVNRHRLLMQDRLASLGRLTSSMTHELSNYLGAMLNSLELIQMRVTLASRQVSASALSKPEQTDLMQHMGQWAEHGRGAATKSMAFLRNVRMLSRQLNVLRRESFSLTSNLQGVCDLMRHECAKYGCTLTTSIGAIEAALYGDPGHFSQVLINLIQNAIEAYPGEPDGSERPIRIVAWEDGERAIVQVIDYGSGIPAEHLPRIFDDGFSTKRSDEYGGIGLTLCQDIITEHFGGNIYVESRQGAGTTLTIALPLEG